MVKEIPIRSEVPTSQTWDLTTIFKDDQAFDAAVEDLNLRLELSDALAEKVSNSGQDLYQALQYGLSLMRDLEKVYVYASMKSDQDTGNQYYQGLNTIAGNLAAQVSSAIAFFDPAVLSL